MRGIALINAIVLVAEVGDFTRFTNPRQLMAYFGLVPGEQSSGETVRRGGITKTGNAHARRALVEGAWAYRMRARIGRHKVDRIEALPKIIRDIGWKAQVRLCTRYRRLRARGKTANVVNVAIAREMVGFIWSIACTIQSDGVQHSRAQHAELELADTAFHAKEQAIVWPTRIIDAVEIDDAGFDKPT